jgi:hypothetical protein
LGTRSAPADTVRAGQRRTNRQGQREQSLQLLSLVWVVRQAVGNAAPAVADASDAFVQAIDQAIFNHSERSTMPRSS